MMILYTIYKIVMTIVLFGGLFMCGALLVKSWYVTEEPMSKAERWFNKLLLKILILISENDEPVEGEDY